MAYSGFKFQQTTPAVSSWDRSENDPRPTVCSEFSNNHNKFFYVHYYLLKQIKKKKQIIVISNPNGPARALNSKYKLYFLIKIYIYIRVDFKNNKGKEGGGRITLSWRARAGKTSLEMLRKWGRRRAGGESTSGGLVWTLECLTWHYQYGLAIPTLFPKYQNDG